MTCEFVIPIRQPQKCFKKVVGCYILTFEREVRPGDTGMVDIGIDGIYIGEL